jgi:hypothetical protein
MIEIVLGVSLATLAITVSNLRCIHRLEKKILYLEFEKNKGVRELDDK